MISPTPGPAWASTHKQHINMAQAVLLLNYGEYYKSNSLHKASMLFSPQE